MTIAIVVCGVIMILLYVMSLLLLGRDYGRIPTEAARAFMAMLTVFVSWLWTVGFALLVVCGLWPVSATVIVMAATAVLAPVLGLVADVFFKKNSSSMRVAAASAALGAMSGVILFALALSK